MSKKELRGLIDIHHSPIFRRIRFTELGWEISKAKVNIFALNMKFKSFRKYKYKKKLS